jgi:WD40 repeat protein/tRNA A-37 threonylcarbamoyl transferase component Bud32
MTEDPLPVEESPSLVAARRLDLVCDRFEALWQAGGRPSLDVFLAEAPADLRTEALRQLLLLEMDYRRRAGEAVVLADYLPRFAHDLAVLNEVLHPTPPDPKDPKGGSPFSDPPAIPARGALGWRTALGFAAFTVPGAEGNAAAALAVPGYEIIGELGQGGMGVVYRARQVKAGRIVALKMILSGRHAGAEQRARFRTEVEAIARLQHPNIVQVYEVGEHAGQPFFSMEFCAGGSLDGKLTGAPLRPREAAALVEQLARAMHVAHQKGIVHRDLKPANVLLAEDGTPKVSDFGLARKLEEASRTVTGAVLGTPSYMAPEQARGRGHEIGPACDVYALGAILYACLTGRPPFRAATPLETVQQVCGQEPVAPRSLNRQVPLDLGTVCQKCLEKEPHRRYASALDLADDLRRFLAGEPVRARPPSALRLAAHWLRRHPVTGVAILAGLLLASSALVGSLWHTAQLGHALGEAERERNEAKRRERQARQLEYASAMRLAQQSWKQGEAFLLPELLERYQPASADEDDYRGFEWRYLSGLCQPALQSWQAYQERTYWIAYSPDGRLLATAGHDRSGDSVKVWDAVSGKLKARLPMSGLRPRYGPPAVFLPGAGGQLAVCDGREVRRWDPGTGQVRGKPLSHPKAVWALAVSGDGRRLFAGGEGPIAVWDLDTEAPPHVLPQSGGVSRLALEPGDRMLAAHHGERFGTIRFWDVATGQAHDGDMVLEPVLVSSPGGSLLAHIVGDDELRLRSARGLVFGGRLDRLNTPTALAIAPDDRLLVAGTGDGGIRFWDLRSCAHRAFLRWQVRAVRWLHFAPDGNKVAVATDDGMVYQVATPVRQGFEPLRPAFAAAGPLACSADGSTLALVSSDGSVKLLDTASGQVRGTLDRAGWAPVALALSADGRTVATVGAGREHVLLWDAASGRETHCLENAGGDRLAFCPTGGLLAVGAPNGTIRLWDAQRGASRGVIQSGAGAIDALVFAPDGSTLATAAGAEGTLELWKLSGGRSSPEPLARLRSNTRTTCLAFFPDGGTLVTGDANGQVRFWRQNGNTLTSARKPLQFIGPMIQVEISRDGRTMLTHSYRTQVELWHLDPLEVRCRLPISGGGEIRAFLCASGEHVVVRAWDGRVEFWDPRSCEMRLPAGQPLRAVRSLAFTPDSRMLITGSEAPERNVRKFIGFSPLPREPYDTLMLDSASATVRVWDVESRTERAELSGPLALAAPSILTLSPDGRTLAAGAPDGSVYLWDRASNQLRTRLFAGPTAKTYTSGFEGMRRLGGGSPIYPEAVQSLSFSADGRWFLTASSRGVVTVWRTDDWREVRTFLAGSTGPAWAAFAPGGDVALSHGGQVQFWDPVSGELRATLEAEDGSPVACAAFGRDGTLLAVAHQDCKIRLWDLPTGRPLGGKLIGHLDQISALAFAPDGKTLASASYDRTVRLWSVAAAAEVSSLEGHRGRVLCLAFSPDGTVLASGGEADAFGQGEVLLWRTPRR